jgi:hypothetical protein
VDWSNCAGWCTAALTAASRPVQAFTALFTGPAAPGVLKKALGGITMTPWQQLMCFWNVGRAYGSCIINKPFESLGLQAPTDGHKQAQTLAK